jgi:transposase
MILCIGGSRGGLSTKIHMVAASDRSAVAFCLSAGNCHDSLEGEMLLEEMERPPEAAYLIMDRAHEGDRTRDKGVELGYMPVVPPKANRKVPWVYDKELYRKRNEIERFFLRLKRFRRVFTRYDKLDLVFSGFIYFAMVVDAMLCEQALVLLRPLCHFPHHLTHTKRVSIA